MRADNDSAIHGFTFWKELMARWEKKWLLRVALSPCPRCGYHDAAPCQGGHRPNLPNANTFVGASADVSHNTTVFTPSGNESAMEEGLLIHPEPSTNYGTAGSSDPTTVAQSQEIVVGKGKKKRIIADDDTTAAN